MGLARGPIPLYFQLANLLRSAISAGQFRSGDVLPTESELCRTYQVSRITVRQALALLVAEGLIQRQQGRGTFVSSPSRNARVFRVQGSAEAVTGLSGEFFYKLLSISTRRPPGRVRRYLKLAADEKAVLFKAINVPQGEPISYIETYVPVPIGSRIRQQDFSDSSILSAIERTGGYLVEGTIHMVFPALVDRRLSQHLLLQVGMPILRIECVYYTAQEKPLEFATAWYRPDRYQYVVELKRAHGIA